MFMALSEGIDESGMLAANSVPRDDDEPWRCSQPGSLLVEVNAELEEGSLDMTGHWGMGRVSV